MTWISSSRRSPQSSRAAEPAELVEHRLLALVVVEDPAVRQMVRHHLEGLRIPGGQLQDVGFTVVEMETGRAALSILSAVAPELVVVDLGLAELSGYDFCEQLRASGSLQHVPLLAISARAMPQDRAAAEEVGVSAFLVKPFTLRQLTDHVVPLMTGSLPER